MISSILNIIYTSKYSYSLIMLIVIYVFIRIYAEKAYITPKASSQAYLLYLNKYYMRSFTYTFSIVMLYFCSYFGLFIILRYYILGTVIELSSISPNINNNTLYIFLCSAFIYLLNIIMYLKILEKLCYVDIIRLHLYLCKYKQYISIKDYFRDNTEIISELIPTKISSFLYEYLEKHKYLSQNNGKALMNKIFLQIPKILRNILWIISIHTSRFLYYARHTMVFLILFYDIVHGKLYYCYFALFIFIFLGYLSKLRKFFAVKDPLEDSIPDHFYEETSQYNDMILYIQNYGVINYNKLNSGTHSVLRFRQELIPYIESNFIIYYVRDPERAANYKVLLNISKRLNIIFALSVIALYLIYNSTKYMLNIMYFKLNIGIPLVLFVIILCFIHNKIRYFNVNDYSAENKKPKVIFYIIVIIVAIFLGYIMLKNKLIFYPNETILNLHDIISVSEIFTIKEKKDYLEHYLQHMQKVIALDQALVEYLIKEVHVKILITEDLLMQNIRDMIQEIISSYKVETKGNSAVTFIDYAKILWVKIKLFFFKK